MNRFPFLLTISGLLSTVTLYAQTPDEWRWAWSFAEPTGNTMYAIHFFDASTGIIAGESGNIHRTTDEGATWSAQMTQERWRWMQSTSPDEQSLWLRADSGYLLATRDRGATWETPAALVDVRADHIQFLPSGTGFLVESDNRIRISHDGGMSWEPIADTIPITRGSTTLYHMLDDTTWFVAPRNNHLLRTTDAGRTWQGKNMGTGEAGVYISDITFSSDSVGFVAISARKTWRTTDRGATWTDTIGGLVIRATRVEAYDNGLVMGVAFDLTLFSWDHGATWMRDSIDPWHQSVIMATTSVDGTIWATGTDGILFASTDSGRTWNARAPSQRLRINDIQFIDEMRGFFVGRVEESGYFPFAATTDGGKRWHPDVRFDGWGEIYDLEIIGSHIWMTSTDARILHSPDLGITWQVQSQDTTDSDFHTIDFADSLHGFAICKNMMMRTVDGGVTWEIVIGKNASQEFHALSAPTPDSVWVGVGKQLKRSTDGGTTWSDSTLTYAINDLHFIDAQNGWYSIATSTGLFRTRDGGRSWRQVNASVGTFTEIHFHDRLHGLAIVSTATYTTDDGGDTWTPHRYLHGRIPARAVFRNEQGAWIAALGGYLHAERRIVTAVAPSRQPLAAPRVRPIPAVDHFVLEGLPEERGRWRVTIHSAVGETVRAIDDVPADGSSLRIMIGELPAGVYVVRIENDITGSIRHARAVVQ